VTPECHKKLKHEKAKRVLKGEDKTYSEIILEVLDEPSENTV